MELDRKIKNGENEINFPNWFQTYTIIISILMCDLLKISKLNSVHTHFYIESYS